LDDDNASAPYSDYIPKQGMILFEHNETKKEIRVELIDRETINRSDMFKVKIFNCEGGGKISKKDHCIVHVVGDTAVKDAIERIEKFIKLSLKEK
jgi:hypothetical protein